MGTFWTHQPLTPWVCWFSPVSEPVSSSSGITGSLPLADEVTSGSGEVYGMSSVDNRWPLFRDLSPVTVESKSDWALSSSSEDKVKQTGKNVKTKAVGISQTEKKAQKIHSCASHRSHNNKITHYDNIFKQIQKHQEIFLNPLLLSMPMYPNWSLSFRFSYHALLLCHVCVHTQRSHCQWFDHPNVCQEVQLWSS